MFAVQHVYHLSFLPKHWEDLCLSWFFLHPLFDFLQGPCSALGVAFHIPCVPRVAVFTGSLLGIGYIFVDGRHIDLIEFAMITHYVPNVTSDAADRAFLPGNSRGFQLLGFVEFLTKLEFLFHQDSKYLARIFQYFRG